MFLTQRYLTTEYGLGTVPSVQEFVSNVRCIIVRHWNFVDCVIF